MKAPSKNISKSLRGQSQGGGRGAEPIMVSGLSKGSSMTVPGDGGVEVAPGKLRDQDRSACNYAEPAGRVK